MYWKTISMVILLVVVISGCVGGIRPGTEIEAELTRNNSQDLGELWKEAEDVMISLGRPVEDDLYSNSYTIGGSGIIVIDVSSRDFDPILFVVDEEGNLVAWNDDWDKSLDARIVIEKPSSSLKLIVASLDGHRGAYDISCNSGNDRDIDEFESSFGLMEMGSITGWVVEDKDDELLASMVKDEISYAVWMEDDNFNAVGFELEGESLVSLEVTSRDFSPIIILLERDDSKTKYITYNDYYSDGETARIDWLLEPGTYMAVITSYSAAEDGEYQLTLELNNDLDAIQPEIVVVEEMNTEYQSEIEPGKGLLSLIWPEVLTGEYYDIYATGSEPCVIFEITVEETGYYDLVAASSDIDLALLVLQKEDEDLEYITYLSYVGDTKYDSKVSEILTPGTYLAIAMPYYNQNPGEVDFRFQHSTGYISTLEPGITEEPFIDWNTPEIVYSFNAVPGVDYTVTAVSEAIDPTIDLYMTGTENRYLTDDDSFGNYDAILEFNVESRTRCLLLVKSYSEYEEGVVEVLLQRS